MPWTGRPPAGSLLVVGDRYRGTQDFRSSGAYELLLELMTDGMVRYRESVEERG